MLIPSNTISHKSYKKKGRGIVNTLINKLPFELHVPGYQFCGPGTKLEKRLARGDTGINLLDQACKEHDIAYANKKDIKGRHEADEILARKAFERFKAKDSSFGEKTAALGITGAMKLKRKLGMGIRRRKTSKRKIKKGRGIKTGRAISLTQAIARARKGIRGKKFKSLSNTVKSALSGLQNVRVKYPKRRIIPIPKTGGFLPLIPLFAGLSALGALGGGAAGIAKAVNDAKSASKKLEEDKRHNQAMESIAIGKKGSGLYLRPYRSGCGLYLRPYSKNC